jgi:hypothetical protein
MTRRVANAIARAMANTMLVPLAKRSLCSLLLHLHLQRVNYTTALRAAQKRATEATTT